MKQAKSKNNQSQDRSDLEEELALLRLISAAARKRQNIPTSGILLATLPRENSQETRYSWDVVNGHGYLRIQEFQHDIRDGSWAPIKGKCFSVRIQELAVVKGFIKKAIDHALDTMQAEANSTVVAQDEDIVIEPLNRDLRDMK